MTNKHQHSESDPMDDSSAENSQQESESMDDSQSEALTAAISEANDLRERLLRWQADFDNLRRRSSGEILEARRNAEGAFAKDLLDVLDHFETALAVDPAKTDAATLLQGVKITYDELKKVLQRRGIEGFDPTGQSFDPNRHEAIAREVNAAVEPMTIVQSFQRGYMMGDKILRPAKVKVSTKE